MLSLGQSKPWKDAMEVMDGQRKMDASALMEYFSPLHEWLKEQNKGHSVGWKEECPDIKKDKKGNSASPLTSFSLLTLTLSAIIFALL